MKLYELEAPEGVAGQDRSNIQPSSSFFEPPRGDFVIINTRKQHTDNFDILYLDHVTDPKPSSMSGVKLFFLLLLGVLGCVACFVIGVMIYQKQQENSRKRFY